VGKYLRKSERILKRWDFTRIQNRGCKVYGTHCLIIALPGVKSNDRVGIVITKKIHKHAVERNRFKRQVREAFRNMAGRRVASSAVGEGQANVKSIDGVIIARPSALNAPSSQVWVDVDRTWTEVRKRCAKVQGSQRA